MLRKFQQEIEQLRKQLENEGEKFLLFYKKFYFLDEGSGGETEEDETDFGERRIPHGHWDEKIQVMESEIQKRRKQLDDERGMAEGERRRLAQELMQKESELANSKTEHERLMNKLASIESKLIIGGENMLEKAEKQAQLLEQSNM